MQSIKVDILKMEVAKFHPKEPVEFKIFFNDGAEKCLMYSSNLQTPVSDATAVIGKIKRYEKDKNTVADARDALDAFVNVMIIDEESMIERISTFFGRVRDEKQKLVNSRDHTNYIRNMNAMHSIKIAFKK
ncbi:TPA: hypothetical protein HA265_00025 [Candidatus Woesearchaeota archaeon]|nr:hypothetical protein [Candidatus Woesearchaeota archaeon]